MYDDIIKIELNNPSNTSPLLDKCLYKPKMLYISSSNESCFLAPIRTPSPYSDEDDNKTLTYEDDDELEEFVQWAAEEEEQHLAPWRISSQAGYDATRAWLDEGEVYLSEQEIIHLESVLNK